MKAKKAKKKAKQLKQSLSKQRKLRKLRLAQQMAKIRKRLITAARKRAPVPGPVTLPDWILHALNLKEVNTYERFCESLSITKHGAWHKRLEEDMGLHDDLEGEDADELAAWRKAVRK